MQTFSASQQPGMNDNCSKTGALQPYRILYSILLNPHPHGRLKISPYNHELAKTAGDSPRCRQRSLHLKPSAPSTKTVRLASYSAHISATQSCDAVCAVMPAYWVNLGKKTSEAPRVENQEPKVWWHNKYPLNLVLHVGEHAEK